MNKTTKYIIAGVVVVAAAGAAYGASQKNKNKPTEVRIEAVENRDLVASVTASGQVRPHTKVDLSSDITGKIVKLEVKEGDYVTKGQFLLELDAQQYDAAVQRAEAGLANAKASGAQSTASLTQAQSNYRRQMEIRKSNPNLVSEDQLEQLKTAVEVNTALADAAKHNVEQAEAGVKDSRVALAKTKIYAPMSGRVTRLVVQNGETAIMGTLNKDAATLLTISDMTVLETKVKVDETDVSRIALGDSAIIQLDAFADTTFVGKVVEISNSSVKAASAGSSDQAIDYEVTIRLLNPPKDTKPDFSATAKIITSSRKQVLSIPIIALTVRENEALINKDTAGMPAAKAPTKQVGKKDVEGVFVVGPDNKVTFHPVKIGIAGEKHFEVISGLKLGDKIVGGTYQAIRELKDGTIVRETKPMTDAKTEKKKP
ncbi:MAG: efflux RND transporter periplasmic adaptor subunit [Gemmatimonadetes bacterium]|nr:efflux RND transporter periplasmic adaptor subunit [Gemmatimonadota bacterium]